MRRESTTSVAWVKLIVDSLKQQGFDCASLCQEAGIPARHLFDPEQRISQKSVTRLWDIAENAINNPCIGISVGQQLDFQHLSVVGYSLLSSEHLGQVLQRLTRYQRLIGEAIQPFQTDEAPEIIVFDRIDHSISRHSMEAAIMGLLTVIKKISSSKITPASVTFTHAASTNKRLYEEAFGCPVFFDHAQDALHLFPATLKNSIARPSNELFQKSDTLIDESLTALLQSDWQLQLRNFLFDKIPQGEPNINDVAGDLGVSAQCLQQKLALEDMSFSQMVDEVRKEKAHHYIHKKELSLQQIAYLLGYTQEHCFLTAFKRWFGVSPSQYRRV